MVGKIGKGRLKSQEDALTHLERLRHARGDRRRARPVRLPTAQFPIRPAAGIGLNALMLKYL